MPAVGGKQVRSGFSCSPERKLSHKFFHDDRDDNNDNCWIGVACSLMFSESLEGLDQEMKSDDHQDQADDQSSYDFCSAMPEWMFFVGRFVRYLDPEKKDDRGKGIGKCVPGVGNDGDRTCFYSNDIFQNEENNIEEYRNCSLNVGDCCFFIFHCFRCLRDLLSLDSKGTSSRNEVVVLSRVVVAALLTTRISLDSKGTSSRNETVVCLESSSLCSLRLET